jgi:hypothetical protein
MWVPACAECVDKLHRGVVWSNHGLDRCSICGKESYLSINVFKSAWPPSMKPALLTEWDE